MKNSHPTDHQRDCPFCSAQDPEGTREVISDNEHAFALLSNPRLLKGHTLVMPKRHVEYPGELTEKEILNIFTLIEKIRSKLLASNLASGVDIRSNYRPFLPQSRLKINHVHFHVLPRNNEDELYQRSMRFEKDLFADLDSEEQNEVMRLFSKTDT